MLKITIQTEPKFTRLMLEGRLTGPWVEELSRCWEAVADSQYGGVQSDVMIDLTGVTFIDTRGKALMTRMWQRGAKFHAVGCLTRSIVEEITTAGEWSSHSSQKDKVEGG
jgi:ABC-type transporter Mla MlaB component